MKLREYRTYDDLDLFELVKQGNERCFEEIYDRYFEKLLAFVYNRLHILEKSKETVQDIFLALWTKRETIDINSTLAGYLYTSARNRILNEFRSDSVRKMYAADFSYYIRHRLDNSNDEHQNLADLEAAINTSIAALPEKCQRVFRMSRQEYLTIAAIAEKLNISTRTVENYLTQALKQLRTDLSDFMLVLLLFQFYLS